MKIVDDGSIIRSIRLTSEKDEDEQGQGQYGRNWRGEVTILGNC